MEKSPSEAALPGAARARKDGGIMTNLEKYNDAFFKALEVEAGQLEGLRYNEIDAWDSVGHMNLVSMLEDAFDIMMDTEDIIDFNSYERGKEILSGKYGVAL